jgi:carbazole 1,9a-dioxygenase terminal dioxygenase component
VAVSKTQAPPRGPKAWRPYIDAKLGFKNHWYPVLLSSDLAEGDVKPVQLCGDKLVLTRHEGVVRCMRDRCMHRGVPLSIRPECLIKGTITCWYHGWTYSWESGDLVTIVSNPESSQIGRHPIRIFPATEAQGLVFVFLGEIEPPALSHDVPPGFLDSDFEVRGQIQTVKSNWRLGVENGFDSGHIWIHKRSRLVTGNDLALPLGFAPPEGVETHKVVENEDGPSGVYDLLGERSMPVFEAYYGDDKIAEGHFGGTRVANEISIWLPCALKVDPWPQEGMVQFEWYVPVDESTHLYVQTLACRTRSKAQRSAFNKAFQTKWRDLALHGFNDDDIWAREAGEPFYSEGAGWIEERLYEPDMAIVEWRKFASRRNRGIQTNDDFYR